MSPLHTPVIQVTSARSLQGLDVMVQFTRPHVPLCDVGQGEIPAPKGGLEGVGRGRGWRGGGLGRWVAELSMYRWFLLPRARAIKAAVCW